MENFTALFANKKIIAVAVVLVAAGVLQWAGFPVTNLISWIPTLFGAGEVPAV